MGARLLSALVLALAIAHPAVVGAERGPHEIELCDFQIPEYVAHANASFSIVYALELDDNGRPVKIESLKNDFLDDGPVKKCLAAWAFDQEGGRVVTVFNWKHGIGWTDISISSPSLKIRVKIQPGACNVAHR